MSEPQILEIISSVVVNSVDRKIELHNLENGDLGVVVHKFENPEPVTLSLTEKAKTMLIGGLRQLDTVRPDYQMTITVREDVFDGDRIKEEFR